VNILLGVSGGIAAYKAADLVSRCVKGGASVRVVMTPAATRFVGPLTFEALCGHPVMTEAWAANDAASSVDHVAWAKWAHVAVVAPATANTVARLACGLADEALSTVFLAIPASTPRWVCPAMNTAMWDQPMVRRNLGWLRDFGYQVVEPVEKRLACGDVGVGAMAEVADIADRLLAR
jgi:phosphopantothenoylcysteine decarboxylase/phosphopantothenate--cysteine ligase